MSGYSAIPAPSPPRAAAASRPVQLVVYDNVAQQVDRVAAAEHTFPHGADPDTVVLFRAGPGGARRPVPFEFVRIPPGGDFASVRKDGAEWRGTLLGVDGRRAVLLDRDAGVAFRVDDYDALSLVRREGPTVRVARADDVPYDAAFLLGGVTWHPEYRVFLESAPTSNTPGGARRGGPGVGFGAAAPAEEAERIERIEAAAHIRNDTERVLHPEALTVVLGRVPYAPRPRPSAGQESASFDVAGGGSEGPRMAMFQSAPSSVMAAAPSAGRAGYAPALAGTEVSEGTEQHRFALRGPRTLRRGLSVVELFALQGAALREQRRAYYLDAASGDTRHGFRLVPAVYLPAGPAVTYGASMAFLGRTRLPEAFPGDRVDLLLGRPSALTAHASVSARRVRERTRDPGTGSPSSEGGSSGSESESDSDGDGDEREGSPAGWRRENRVTHTVVDLRVQVTNSTGAPAWLYVTYPVGDRLLRAGPPPDDVRDGRAEWAVRVPPGDSTMGAQLVLQGDGA